jgi:hypothetical protein
MGEGAGYSLIRLMRNVLLILAAMVGLAASACKGASAQAAPQTDPVRRSKPNLMFIIADQLRYQS